MTPDERKAVELVAFSHGWMLKTIRHKANETQGGNYSDELKLAILNDEWLEQFRGTENDRHGKD